MRLVNGKDVLNRNNVLNNALSRNDVDVKSLRNFLNNSVNNNEEVIKNAFNNVAIGDVVAIDVLSNGDVVGYYRHQREKRTMYLSRPAP